MTLGVVAAVRAVAPAAVFEAGPFRSTHEALCFAFSRRVVYPRSVMSRWGGDPTFGMATGPDRGLGGVDGAATAGIVISIIDQTLSDTDAAILTARFTQRTIPCSCGRTCCQQFRYYLPWLEAVALLVEALPNPFPETRANYTVRQACIRKFFGEKVSFVEAAEQARVHRDTVSLHNSRISRMLNDDQRRALYVVGAALSSAGLISE